MANVTKKRIGKSFTIPGNAKEGREIRVCNVGDEVTAAMSKDWDAWQKEANSGGTISIKNYTE